RAGAAVGRGRSRFAWRAVTDDGAARNQRGAVGDLPRVLDRKSDRFGIVTVAAGGVPVRGLEPFDLIVGDGEAGRTVDRDLVVVEEDDEPPELEVAGERDRLVAVCVPQAASTACQ